MAEPLMFQSDSGKMYREIKTLGEGVSAVVYQAVDIQTNEQVAVKVLRAHASEMLANNFWLEGDVLGELYRAEQDLDGVHAVPRVLGFKRGGEPRFIVMELVRGRALDDLLQERGTLSEVDALAVADQTLRVLDLLHARVRRSYTDLQLKNIWLTENSAGDDIRIKIMDWNHVSEKAAPGTSLSQKLVVADLSRFTAYLYRMLTGKGANENGEPLNKLERVAGAAWENISPATREMIRRGLHPTPGKRFQSAAEFKSIVQAQREAWTRDWADHLADAQSALSVTPLTVQAQRQAANALFLARANGAEPDKVQYYELRLPKQDVRQQAAQSYYDIAQYATAAKLFQEVAEDTMLLQDWRWVMAARAGEASGRSIFASAREYVDQAVHHLNQGQPELAQRDFDKIQLPTARPRALENLAQETRARVHVARARMLEASANPDDWDNAAREYQNADTALRAIENEYAALVREEEGWSDLLGASHRISQRAEQRRIVNAQIAEMRQRFAASAQAGLDTLAAALRNDPTNELLASAAMEQGESFIKRGSPGDALAVCDLLLLHAQAPTLQTRIVELRQKALNEIAIQERARAETQTARAMLDALKKERWQEFQTLAEKIPDDASRAARAWRVLCGRTTRRFAQALGAQEEPTALVLYQILQRLDPEPGRMTARQEQLNEMRAKIRAAQSEWNAKTAREVQTQLDTAQRDPKQAAILIAKIDTALALWSENQDPQMRQTLVTAKSKLENANAAREHQAEIRQEAETLLSDGLKTLQALTVADLAAAQTKFAGARAKIDSLDGITDAALKQQIEHAQQLPEQLRSVVEALDRAQEKLGQAREITAPVARQEALELLQQQLAGVEKRALQIWNGARVDGAPNFKRIIALQDALAHERQSDGRALLLRGSRLYLAAAVLVGLVVLMCLALGGALFFWNGSNTLRVQNAELENSKRADQTRSALVVSALERNIRSWEARVTQSHDEMTAAKSQIEQLQTQVAQGVSGQVTPTTETPSATPRTDTPTPTDTETPTPELTKTPEPKGFPEIKLTRVGTQTLFDFPIVRGAISPTHQIRVAGNQWFLEPTNVADPNQPISMTLELQLDGARYQGANITIDATGVFTLTPEIGPPPLSPKENYVAGMVVKLADGTSKTLGELKFTVAEAPTAILNDIRELRDKQGKVITANDLKNGARVQVTGRAKTKPRVGYAENIYKAFVQIRPLNSRTTYWIPYPGTGPVNLSEISEEQVNNLPEVE